MYGRQVKKPVKRPVVDVRFRHAHLFLNGRQTVINLNGIRETIAHKWDRTEDEFDGVKGSVKDLQSFLQKRDDFNIC